MRKRRKKKGFQIKGKKKKGKIQMGDRRPLEGTKIRISPAEREYQDGLTSGKVV